MTPGVRARAATGDEILTLPRPPKYFVQPLVAKSFAVLNALCGVRVSLFAVRDQSRDVLVQLFDGPHTFATVREQLRDVLERFRDVLDA